MSTGMLFTSLVSFLVFIASLSLSIYLFRNRASNDKKMLAYNWFWLITSGLWFFASLRVFFAWQGMPALDRKFFMADQVFVFLTPIPLLYYLVLKTSKSEQLSKTVLYAVSLLSGLSIFLLFKHGIVEGPTTYFTTKFQPPSYSFNIFLSLALLIIAIAGYDVLKREFLLLKKTEEDRAEFFYSLAILIYLLIGIFDEQGLIAGWSLALFRLSYLGVFLLVYFIFDTQTSQKRSIIESSA